MRGDNWKDGEGREKREKKCGRRKCE
jgi:hypothetical protein